jgi:hypothetical protein
MTWFKCCCCGEGFNSDTKPACPSCHTPVGWNSPFVHRVLSLKAEQLKRDLCKEQNPVERDRLLMEFCREMEK